MKELKHCIIKAIDNSNYTEVLQSNSILIDVYGRREANKTALYILLSQSIKAREYLYNIWLESLPCNSEISCALRRLNNSNDIYYNSSTVGHIQKTALTDEAFLKNSTIAYNR